MTGTFVYIHGTGVPDLARDEARIRARLAADGRFEGWRTVVPDWTATFGPWGLDALASVIPPRAGILPAPPDAETGPAGTGPGFDDVVRTIARDTQARAATEDARASAGLLGEDLLLAALTSAVAAHREDLTRLAAEYLRSVLLFFARREAVREAAAAAIADAVAGRPGPLVVAGHSLGGAVAIDALTAAPRERTLLVTLGGQLPLFAVLGLGGPFGAGVGERPFAPWLNVYNRRDPLAFVAGAIWPRDAAGSPEDFELIEPRNLPEAHSGYIDRPELYAAIAARVAGIEH